MPGGDDLHVLLDAIKGLLVIHKDLRDIAVIIISESTEAYILFFMNEREGGRLFRLFFDLFPYPQKTIEIP